MPWGETVLWWLPTAAVTAMAALALAALAVPPRRPAWRYWLAALLLGGGVAIGASVWQQWVSREQEIARAAEGAAHLAEFGRLLGATPDAPPTADTVALAIQAQNGRIADLESRVHALQEASHSRTIDADTAAKIAESLRPFGSHRVVVSCVPEDVEAYTYANRIANVLRAAGWEALGPQTTTIFGDAPAMGVTLYVHGAAAQPEAARLLLDAFTGFNIPYQSGVAPNDAIPDPQTVELFVGKKP